MFDNHEIVFAGQSPTESFNPSDFALDAIASESRAELFRIFPLLKSKIGLAFCKTVRPMARGYEVMLVSRFT